MSTVFLVMTPCNLVGRYGIKKKYVSTIFPQGSHRRVYKNKLVLRLQKTRNVSALSRELQISYYGLLTFTKRTVYLVAKQIRRLS